VSSFAVTVTSASILFSMLVVLSILMFRFNRLQFPPLMIFGSLSFAYLALESAVEYLEMAGDHFNFAVQLHRVSELIVVSLLVALMFLLDRLFRLPTAWRKVTRTMMWIAAGFTVALTVVAFVVPDLFVSVTNPAGGEVIDTVAYVARGEYGPVYDARNLFMAAYAPYALLAMIVAGSRRARVGQIWIIIAGTALVIASGLADVVAMLGGRYLIDSLDFGRYSLGITAFMIGATASVMSRFSVYAREVHDAANALQSHQARLREIATTDQLTSLPNRATMISELGGMDSVSVVAIDIDFFRTVNEAYGRTRADRALQVVARRINKVCGNRCRVYRAGPDRFMALCLGRDTPEEVLERARRIVADIRRPVAADGMDIYITASAAAVLASGKTGRTPCSTGLRQRLKPQRRNATRQGCSHRK
jgi:diguanylate cyclase (GGDEF)-like protein